MLSFFKNFLLSTSFVLQKQRRIPSIVVSLNQWTGIIVSSLLEFSKSRMTSFTNFRSLLLNILCHSAIATTMLRNVEDVAKKAKHTKKDWRLINCRSCHVTVNISNSIERLLFDWDRQSNKIEHLFCWEFDFRTDRIKSN